jgi:hypothetical protein
MLIHAQKEKINTHNYPQDMHAQLNILPTYLSSLHFKTFKFTLLSDEEKVEVPYPF